MKKLVLAAAIAGATLAASSALAGNPVAPIIDVVGIDVHIGSQLTSLEPYEAAYRKVAELTEILRADGHKIDRLDHITFDFAVTNLPRNPRCQSGHARKRPPDHGQQVVRHHVSKLKPADLRGPLSLGRPDRIKNRVPKEDLRHDRQETHQRSQCEVASIHQSLFKADA